MVRKAIASFVVGIAVAPFVVSPIAIEPDRPLADRVPSPKKDSPIGALEEVPVAEPVVTYGVAVSLRENEIVVLSDAEPSAQQFSKLLRDRVTGDAVEIAPRLLALLRRLSADHADSSGAARVEIVSGYRSWKLNEMLRKKGGKVASNSQHCLGAAMDFRLSGMSSKQLADTIEKTGWQGGLAFYPGDTDRFVHADVGPNRRWRGR